MPTPKLPKTTIRLATASSFFVLKEDALSLSTFFKSIFQPRQEIVDVQRQMQQVLGLVSFSEEQSRTPEHRYEVDSNVRGQPLEVMAGPVTRSFKIRRAVLYKSDLIQALAAFNEDVKTGAGTKDAGLLSQAINKPFIFIKKDSAPEGAGVSPVVTFYRGCIISSISRSYDVSGSAGLGVFEDASISYAGRQQFTS